MVHNEVLSKPGKGALAVKGDGHPRLNSIPLHFYHSAFNPDEASGDLQAAILSSDRRNALIQGRQHILHMRGYYHPTQYCNTSLTSFLNA